mgnify:CR=1 FL=1
MESQPALPLARARGARALVFYGGMLAVAVAAFFAVRSVGVNLTAPGGPGLCPVAAGQSMNTLFHSLLALAAIIVTSRLVGVAFRHLGQPSVIGEVFGGILLGPSLLGSVAPSLYALLLPSSVAPFLGTYAQIGVILYLFLVGLELDLGILRTSGQAALAISHASIVVPFFLGSCLALVLYPALSTSAVPFTVFALFLGVSLSVTAFPVLARILTDQGISRSRMGALALTCAAIDDVTAWCLLAVVVSIAQSDLSDAVRTVALTGAFVVVVLKFVAPVVRQRLLPRIEQAPDLTRTSLSIIFSAILLSAMTTEFIGIHGFFGAFLFGAIIPHSSRIAGELTRRLDDIVAVLLLPAFFAYTGMRTQIGLVSGAGNWLLCAAIIAVACVGKFGGTVMAARFSGLGWRDASALGVLMNTRGMVELIVLNLGLDLGVISPTLFTMLVIMALVTTFIATPLLHWLLRDHPWIERSAGHVGAMAG